MKIKWHGLFLIAATGIASLGIACGFAVWEMAETDSEKGIPAMVASIECHGDDAKYQDIVVEIFNSRGADVHIRSNLVKAFFTVTRLTESEFHVSMMEIKNILAKSGCEVAVEGAARVFQDEAPQ